MKNSKGYLGAVLILSLLAGPAHPQTKAPAKKEAFSIGALIKSASPLLAMKSCTATAGGSCIVKITVDDKCASKPVADPPVIQVNPGVHIIWMVTGGTWEFDPNDGISFKKSDPPFEGKLRDSPKVFHWQSKADAAGKGYFAYNIKLKKGEQVCEVDPGVWV